MKKLILVPVLVLLLAMLSCNFLNRGVEQVVGETINLSGKHDRRGTPGERF